MPRFDTPAPIHARIDLAAGAVRVHASDRSDTVVELRPGSDSSSADLQATEQTRVEYADGALLVQSPRKPRLLFFSTGPSVDVELFLPQGSRLDVVVPAGDIACDGSLGSVTVSCRYGDIRIDRSATVRADTSAGDISLNVVTGDAEATTAYGAIRVNRADGDLRLHSACGDIHVELAESSVAASTKYGEVRVRDAVRGSLDLETAYGTVEAGVREGTATWLDLQSSSGKVRNTLTPSDAPNGPEETLRLRARTSYGDILVRRA